MKKPSTRLSPLISYLDDLLNTAAVSDYPGAVNGLQIANSGVITRIAAAVDACEAVISEAARVKGTLLLVHHGLFWNGVQPITGPLYMKTKTALDGDLALYSSHLPLDLHPKLGNNILLAKALGLNGIKPAIELMGQSVGVTGRIKSLTRDAFALRLSEAIGAKVHVAAGGSKKIQSVLVVTGGAGSEVARAASLGVDAFVTGEGPHWSYTAAEELGVNLFYAGHYATETFGVKALASHLSAKTGLPWSFVDHPTGL
ncbi:MAG: Nif3-like dinuclear metal center hexameric protein [Chthoniobacterales bacterium]